MHDVTESTERTRALTDLAPAAPFALWVRGEVAALVRPGIVVVGNEHMSAHGLHTCLDFVSQWAALGYAIYSSAEHGIATAAILATLAVNGTPVVITSTPHEAASELDKRAASAGAFATERPPGDHRRRKFTSRRNWLLVASSATTIVIDASLASPSIDLAESARSLGRRTGVIIDHHSSRSDPAIAYLLDEMGSSPIVRASDINLL